MLLQQTDRKASLRAQLVSALEALDASSDDDTSRVEQALQNFASRLHAQIDSAVAQLRSELLPAAPAVSGESAADSDAFVPPFSSLFRRYTRRLQAEGARAVAQELQQQQQQPCAAAGCAAGCDESPQKKRLLACPKVEHWEPPADTEGQATLLGLRNPGRNAWRSETEEQVPCDCEATVAADTAAPAAAEDDDSFLTLEALASKDQKATRPVKMIRMYPTWQHVSISNEEQIFQDRLNEHVRNLTRSLRRLRNVVFMTSQNPKATRCLDGVLSLLDDHQAPLTNGVWFKSLQRIGAVDSFEDSHVVGMTLPSLTRVLIERSPEISDEIDAVIALLNAVDNDAKRLSKVSRCMAACDAQASD